MSKLAADPVLRSQVQQGLAQDWPQEQISQRLRREYVPAVISEGFPLSLLTAGLLKIALEVVLHFKGRIVRRLQMAATPWAKISAGILLWVVAAGSRIVVLELVALVFGDAVSLGGFVSVTLLVMASPHGFPGAPGCLNTS